MIVFADKSLIMFDKKAKNVSFWHNVRRTILGFN